jgi:hypothetical protein
MNSFSPSTNARRAIRHSQKDRFVPKATKPEPPGRVTHVGPGLYDVESSKGKKVYRVNLNPEVLTCECPHFQCNVLPAWKNGKDVPECKHITAAKQERKEKALRVARGLTNDELSYRLNFQKHPIEVEEAMDAVLRERGFYSLAQAA